MPTVAVNAASTSTKLVVGVDDAEENLFLLQSALKKAGYSFYGLRSGRECLSFISRVTPRLLLLDIEMPDLDGFETCRRLRDDREIPPFPIAFLTARKTPEDVKRGLGAGGNDFIVKPFDPAKLLERVRYWTSRSVGHPSAMAS